MEAVPKEATRPEETAENHLGLGVAASDAGHDVGTSGAVIEVDHGRYSRRECRQLETICGSLSRMPPPAYSDREAAAALVRVLEKSRWEAVALARGFLALEEKRGEEAAARAIYDAGPQSLKRSRELAGEMRKSGFLRLLAPRERVGSAENPITKLFPATVTEQRFMELLDELREGRPALTYLDDREAGHGLEDFTLSEGDHALPFNVKNAGTRFAKAKALVGLEPDDCVPIPTYKAHAAIESTPNLLYAVSVDYDLVEKLGRLLPKLFAADEGIVWDLLNRHAGALVRNAEDMFIFGTVRRHWEKLRPLTSDRPFQVISARKAIRILQTKPQRTPGVGIPAWGTGASAEVNVHVSIREDMTPWETVRQRLVTKGVVDIVEAVNRRRQEWVYDPEI